MIRFESKELFEDPPYASLKSADQKPSDLKNVVGTMLRSKLEKPCCGCEKVEEPRPISQSELLLQVSHLNPAFALSRVQLKRN